MSSVVKLSSRLALVLGMCLSVAGLGASSAGAAAPQLTMLSDSSNVTLNPHATTKDVAVTVLNPTSQPVRVTVAFQAPSWTPQTGAAGISVKPPVKPIMAGAGATRIGVTLTGLSQLPRQQVTGQLVVHGGARPIAQGITITPGLAPSHSWPTDKWTTNFAIWSVLGFVLLFVLGWMSYRNVANENDDAAAAADPADRGHGPQPGAAARKADRSFFRSPAPGPDWTPTGWSANLTVIGGVLSTAIAAVTFPDVPREISKDTLIRINLVYVVLVFVGPFMFSAIRRAKAPKAWEVGPLEGKGLDKPGLWGWKWILMTQYALTTVAVIGQLGAMTLLGSELTAGDHVARACLIVAAGLLGFLAVVYFWTAVGAQWRCHWLERLYGESRDRDADEPLKRKHFPLTARGIADDWAIDVTHGPDGRLELEADAEAEIVQAGARHGD